MNISDSGEFRILRLSAEEREEELDGTQIVYLGNTACHAEYTHGVELETDEGDIVESETAGLSMVYVSEDVRHEGIGTKLMAKAIERAREDGFSYLRAKPIIDRHMVGLIEKVLAEGLIKERAYKVHIPTDMFDLRSGELLRTLGTTPEEAAASVKKRPRVECVMEL